MTVYGDTCLKMECYRMLHLLPVAGSLTLGGGIPLEKLEEKILPITQKNHFTTESQRTQSKFGELYIIL
jgi:hypothetical protein